MHAYCTTLSLVLIQPLTDTHAHTTQLFYGSLDFVWDNPGEPVPEGTFHHILDILEQNEDITGRCTNKKILVLTCHTAGVSATAARLLW